MLAVSGLVSERLDPTGVTREDEDKSLRRVLVQLAEAAGGSLEASPKAVRDDETRINLELPFRVIAECQRLMRASRTGINRRDSGGAGFLLRIYARAADALVAEGLETTGLRAGAEQAAARQVRDAICEAVRAA